MYRRILVPLDGSPLAEQVLPYVRLLAPAFQARVHLLRTFEPVPPELANPSRGVYLDQLAAALRNQAQESLIPVMAALEDMGLSASTSAHEGDPATHIVDEAEKEPGTLIAMCTHGRSGIRRWMLGSVTDKVLHATTSPMLIVRASPQDRFSPEVAVNTIIVPLDGSPLAEQILPHVVALASALGTEVRLVRATPAREEDSGAADYLAHVGARLLQEGVPAVQEQVLHGEAAAAIVDLTQHWPGALVAMTTHGRSGMQRWIMGSVTERVARFSRGPVLISRAT